MRDSENKEMEMKEHSAIIHAFLLEHCLTEWTCKQMSIEFWFIHLISILLYHFLDSQFPSHMRWLITVKTLSEYMSPT